MNNRRKFFLNGIITSAVGIALRTVALVFGAYLSREIGAEGIGLNTLIMSAYGFALTFATSGIGLTVTRLVASHIGTGDEERITATLRGAGIYATAFSLVATVILAGFSGFFAKVCIGDQRAIFPLQILSLSLIPTALCGVISGYFIARRLIGRNSAVGVLSQVVRIAVTVFLLLGITERGVEESVGAICIGFTVSEFICLLMYLAVFIAERYKRGGAARGGAELRPVAEMALPLAMSAYIRSGLLSLEHNLIPRRLEDRGESLSSALSSFGSLHGMALPMVTYPMTPLSSFSGLLVPEFAEAEAEGNVRKLSRIASDAIRATLTYAILAAAVLFVFSEELGYSVYGSYSAGYFITILAPIVPIMYIDHVVDSMLKGIGEHVYSMWVNIIDSALSVLLVWLLIPIFGIEGYALVIIGMEAFNFLLSYTRLRKRIDFRLDFLRSVVIPLLAAIASALAVDFLFVTGSSLPVWVTALKIVFTVSIYLAVYIPTASIYEKLLSNRIRQRSSEPKSR